jgi:predicted amidohydrolase
VEHRIDRIGYFYFVAGHADPLGALQAALGNYGDVSHSLIVLPEGFNNGRPYNGADLHDRPQGRGAQIDHRATLRKLTCIAESKKVVFVVGILDGVYNSAYLAEGGQARLMCRKAGNDGTGNYNPCTADCDKDNPVDFPEAGVSIITSICMDFSGWARLDSLTEKCGAGRRVLCIPASMSAEYFTGDSHTSGHLLGKYVVLANSTQPNRADCGSFIGSREGRKVARCGPAGAQGGNTIQLCGWSELDGC